MKTYSFKPKYEIEYTIFYCNGGLKTPITHMIKIKAKSETSAINKLMLRNGRATTRIENIVQNIRRI